MEGKIHQTAERPFFTEPSNLSQTQDHYAVLGLSKYRWRATDEQIKKAHRKKVLRHHPDKKAAAGAVDDDNFFKCIQKGNVIRRKG